MQFTTILHKVRKHFGLTCNEYCVVELVFFSQNNPKTKKAGWCTLSRNEMGEALDFSRQTIITILKKAKDLGLVEEDESFNVKTTALWFNAISLGKTDSPLPCQDSLQGVKNLDSKETVQGVKNLDTNCKETVHPPVKSFDTPLYINKEINEEERQSVHVRAHEGDFEKENLTDWAQKEREEMIALVEEMQKESPPSSAAPPLDKPKITYTNLHEVLLKDRLFVDLAKYKLKLRTDKAFVDMVMDYAMYFHGIGRPLEPDYQKLKSHILYNAINKPQNQSKAHGNNATNRNSKTGGQTAIITDDDEY